jgi:hypothetical protein
LKLKITLRECTTKMKWLERIFLTIISIVVGFICYPVIVEFYSITFKKEISISEALNVIATIVAAYIISLLIQKRYNERRLEKDLVIHSVKVIFETIKKIENLISTANETTIGPSNQYEAQISKERSQEIISQFNLLSKQLIEIKEECEDFDFKKVKTNFNDANDRFITFKKRATGGKFPSIYSKNVLNDLHKKIREFKKAIRKVLVDINRT